MEKRFIIIFVIIIIVAAILVFTLTSYIKNGNELNNVNNMEKDISILEDSVSIYYLNNSSLPIKENEVKFDYSINPNDDSLFYEIDIRKLKNIDLTYGMQKFGNDDIYIINNNSHTIYYLKGIEYKDKMHYTKELSYEYVDLEKYK